MSCGHGAPGDARRAAATQGRFGEGGIGRQLTVARWDTFVLVGESGSGKTTLGRCVVALESVTSGRICIEGEDVITLHGRRLRHKRRDMQLMFQDPF